MEKPHVVATSLEMVEEESERRAQDRYLAPATESSAFSTKFRDRRRGSLSISVFGQPSQTSIENTSNGSMSTLLSPLANAASRSQFYHSLANPKSMDSLISERSADDDIRSEDDYVLVTRMQTIAGRHNRILTTVDKVSALLSRKLSHKRTRATSISIPPAGDMVIGVSVEQATVEAETDKATFKRATAYAGGTQHTLRKRTSWLSMPGNIGQGGIGMKTKAFTQKFRRKFRRNSDCSS